MSTRKVRQAQAGSTLLNLDRKFHLDCITKGVKVPGVQTDEQGWSRVSYHMAGMRSAWVQQNRIRRGWPTLETECRNVADQPCDWNAEIWVRLKKETQDDTAAD